MLLVVGGVRWGRCGGLGGLGFRGRCRLRCLFGVYGLLSSSDGVVDWSDGDEVDDGQLV